MTFTPPNGSSNQRWQLSNGDKVYHVDKIDEGLPYRVRYNILAIVQSHSAQDAGKRAALFDMEGSAKSSVIKLVDLDPTVVDIDIQIRSVGVDTPEPSIRDMVYMYYRQTHGKREAKTLATQLINAVAERTK